MNHNTKTPFFKRVIGALISCSTFISCSDTPNVPLDTKHLEEFHKATTPSETVGITTENLALFVDYSNCIANGMSSAFYQKIVSPLTAATKEYWSIKGDQINKETGSVYSLLNNIEEISYAALDVAIEQMAERNTEAVMLTDGELFTQTATKNNPNNPYMHAAFKKWLLKGHDIHIIAEPFQESYKGHEFNKKRFYIIFTDDRLEGNIYKRIKEIVNLKDYPQVSEFHLSGNYPWPIPTNGKHSEPNPIVAANTKGFDAMEIQDWQVDWKNITELIVNGYDEEGNPLPNGDKIISGLKVNKNAFGCYQINNIDIRVSCINAAYFDYYNRLEAGEKVDKIAPSPLLKDFIIADAEKFKEDGSVDLYFDINNFAPDADLTGTPYNYLKIEIITKDLENVIGNNIDIFKFDSIVNDGQMNESISESLKNCVFDPELLNKLKGKTLYTIYIKSDKY